MYLTQYTYLQDLNYLIINATKIFFNYRSSISKNWSTAENVVILVEADIKLKEAQKEGEEVCEILQEANDDNETQDGLSVERLQVPILEDLQKTVSPSTSKDHGEKANSEEIPKSVFAPIAKDINQKQVSHFKAMALLGKLFFGMKKQDTINEDKEPSPTGTESSYEDDSDDFEDEDEEDEISEEVEKEEKQVKAV